jgi:uncharacterized protein YaiE (UPF0345 family)
VFSHTFLYLNLPPTTTIIMQFENVTAIAKGNVYFDGNVVSHVIILASGEKKSMGVIMPGTYHFGTEAAEIMDMVDGAPTCWMEPKIRWKFQSDHRFRLGPILVLPLP